MPDIKQLGAGQTTSRRMFINSTDGKTGSSGLSPEITVALPGTVFSTTISPLTTDIGRGWYDVQITTAHTPTIGETIFSYVATAGQDPAELKLKVNEADWQDVSDIYSAEFGHMTIDTTANTMTIFRAGDTTTSVQIFSLTAVTGTQPFYGARTT